MARPRFRLDIGHEGGVRPSLTEAGGINGVSTGYPAELLVAIAGLLRNSRPDSLRHIDDRSWFLYEGYSHISQAVSELGGVDAQYPIVQNVNFFVLGILMVAFAIGLHRGIDRGTGSKLGPILIGIFGVSAGIGNALLPCDTGCEFISLTGTLHNVTGLGGFLAAIAGIFLISRRLKQDPDWQAFLRYSSLTAVAAAATLILWIGVSKAAGVESVNGVLQRLFIAVWLVWVEVMAIRLFLLSRRALA